MDVHSGAAVAISAEYEVRNTTMQVPCWWRSTSGRRANLNTRMITAATILYGQIYHEVPR